MKKVMAFGTFDNVHLGHIFFLKKAKKLGDYLIVVIARDKTVAIVKKKSSRHSENDRLKSINDLGIADSVVLGSLTNKFELLLAENPDVLALGYDQSFFTQQLKKILPNTTSIVRIDSFKPEIYKSSKLAKLI